MIAERYLVAVPGRRERAPDARAQSAQARARPHPAPAPVLDLAQPSVGGAGRADAGPPAARGPHARRGARGSDGLRGTAAGRGDGVAVVGGRRRLDPRRAAAPHARGGQPARAACRCGGRWPTTSRPGARSREAAGSGSSSRLRASRGPSTCGTGAPTTYPELRPGRGHRERGSQPPPRRLLRAADRCRAFRWTRWPSWPTSSRPTWRRPSGAAVGRPPHRPVAAGGARRLPRPAPRPPLTAPPSGLPEGVPIMGDPAVAKGQE